MATIYCEKILGSELIFLKRISNNGMELEEVGDVTPWMLRTTYDILRLSMYHKTFIARNMSTYIVKKREDE